MKAMQFVLCVVLIVVPAGMASAAGLEKGSNLFAVQLTEGVADLVGPEADGFVSAYDHSELGGQVQFWHLLSDEYAFNLSGGIGFFSETDKPGTGAPGADDFKYTQSSWSARVGGDRLAKLGGRMLLFAGPGLQIWSGKPKFESGSTSTEGAQTLRIAAEGRIGLMMAWSDNVGLVCQLGHYIGYASSTEDRGAKATWWPSGHDGAVGIAFKF